MNLNRIYQSLVLSLLQNLRIYDPVNMFNSKITVFMELSFQKAHTPLVENYVSRRLRNPDAYTIQQSLVAWRDK